MSHLEQNLAALAPVFPALATLLRQTPLPEGFAPQTGTDGTPTFCRVVVQDGRKSRQWLGATSMPAASAGAIVASLDAAAGGASGLGLSIGTGYEWAAFAARLARPQLIYVYEPDAGLLRMALTVCDLTTLLADRRLILLTGPASSAAEILTAFLKDNPGFDAPSVLHPPPTLTGPRRSQLLADGEAIVRHAVTQRQAQVAQLSQTLAAAAPYGTPASPPQTLALLLTPRYPAERPIQRAVLGATHLTIDRHDQASLALRLATLADMLQRGPVRIISDLFRDQLQPLPAHVAVETWIPPLAGAALWDRLPPAATLALSDRIIVHAPWHARLLQDRAIPRDHIEVRDLARLYGAAAADHPAKSEPTAAPPADSPLTLRHRIALIADLPVTDAAALGVELPTHQAVFSAARALIEADFLGVHPDMAADILRRALIRAGVDPKSDDPALQAPMLRLVRHVLIPAIPLLCLVQTLAQERVALTLIGDWPRDAAPAGTDVRHIPFHAYDAGVWTPVALLAHVSPQGTYSPLLLDAVAAGVPMAAPAPAHPADASLAAHFRPEIDFAQPPARNYLATLLSLLRDAPRRQKLAAAARGKLATNKHE